MKSVVEIYDQGGKLYGKIVSLAEPHDAQGKSKICNKWFGAEILDDDEPDDR